MKNIVMCTITLILLFLCGFYIYTDSQTAHIEKITVKEEPIPIEKEEVEIHIQPTQPTQMISNSEYCPSQEFTQDEIDLMARVVMSEASVLDSDAKQAVASVILNRLYSKWRYYAELDTVEDVVRGCFSTQDNGEPTQECYDAVYAAIENPNGFPPDMYWLWKSDRSPEEGAVVYCNFGKGKYKTYFFTLTDYEREVD